MNKASESFKKKCIGLHPNLILLLGYALATSKIDFFISEGVRTSQKQNEYFKKGRDKDGNIINKKEIVTNMDGYIKKSKHQIKDDGYGHAVDIYYVGWSYKNNKEEIWKELIKHIEVCAKQLNIKINCGFYWKTLKDNPHIELI